MESVGELVDDGEGEMRMLTWEVEMAKPGNLIVPSKLNDFSNRELHACGNTTWMGNCFVQFLDDFRTASNNMIEATLSLKRRAKVI